MRPRIVIAESHGFAVPAVERLRAVGEVVLADLDRAGLCAAVREADVLWVRLRHRIDDEVLAAAPRLALIATATTGLNHIDLDAAGRRGIRVISLQGETDFLQTVRATAEHALGLLLALVRHLPAAARHVTAGGWNRDEFQGNELYGRTAGVVGYGRLGRIVARYLRALDLRVLAADPMMDESTPEAGVEPVPLPVLLRESDIVTLHVNLCPATRGMFGAEQFAAMKPGAWFLNTARGELVDEAALLAALHSGRLTGAALDVLSEESSDGMAQHPLVRYARTHANLLITPHIGGGCRESMERTEIFLAERVCAALADRDRTLTDQHLAAPLAGRVERLTGTQKRPASGAAKCK